MPDARRGIFVPVIILAAATLACSISIGDTPTATGVASLSPSGAYFRVVVIVDTASEPVSRQQAEEVIAEGSRILSDLTPFEFQMLDYVEDGNGGMTTEIAGRYIESHPSSLPDGMVIFSFGDDGLAKMYGGYAMRYGLRSGFRNRFVSPTLGSNNIYLAVIHFNGRFGLCGYGGADSPQSTVAIDGECANHPGTACAQHDGYSICEDVIDDLYVTNPAYYTASGMIHELMHSFQPQGDLQETYHYGSPECNARMGRPSNYFDEDEARHYNTMCPFIYTDFTTAYQP